MNLHGWAFSGDFLLGLPCARTAMLALHALLQHLQREGVGSSHPLSVFPSLLSAFRGQKLGTVDRCWKESWSQESSCSALVRCTLCKLTSGCVSSVSNVAHSILGLFAASDMDDTHPPKSRLMPWAVTKCSARRFLTPTLIPIGIDCSNFDALMERLTECHCRCVVQDVGGRHVCGRRCRCPLEFLQ